MVDKDFASIEPSSQESRGAWGKGGQSIFSRWTALDQDLGGGPGDSGSQDVPRSRCSQSKKEPERRANELSPLVCAQG